VTDAAEWHVTADGAVLAVHVVVRAESRWHAVVAGAHAVRAACAAAALTPVPDLERVSVEAAP
jgi:hypothetical protein